MITTSISLLIGTIPHTRDPEVARRWIELFVLPALVNNPPPPHAVFDTDSNTPHT
jgi:desulfoferrodoxin (superoxide reductase-like protein)